MPQLSEKAFEDHVEELLLSKGWERGSRDEWDKERALFPSRIVSFIADSQPELWDSLRAQLGDQLEPKAVETLVKELATKGTLHILRHGFKFYGKTLRVAYFKPAHGLNPDVLALYEKNRLTVSRQIPCHPGDTSAIDLLLSVNGLPVATCELKNPNTNQNWRHAVRQYCEDRNPNAPLFTFKQRALVHFAADPGEVHMTTRLNGAKTFFLPFNRGSHPGEVICGAGNPAHSSGYRTGYLWEETLERDSFLDILGHYLFIEKREEKVDDGRGGHRIVVKEAVIFPRYHQLHATRKLIALARAEGTGHNYLIQHSAGSGKTNSISWLSHRLASLHTDDDHKVYDCVIVITDRQVLDQQLQDAIYQIEHAQGVVKAIDQNSKQLADALIDGTKIVVTTLQKFPFVLRGLLHAAGAENLDDADDESKTRAKAWEEEIGKRRYAMIVDEAHSSQTGETARELKAILGANSQTTEDDDWEDGLNQVLASRGRQPNLSFFAYTATPKGKTLELFGRPGASGKPEPTHLYSMRQAIEEGFILDVLRNYTTYKTFFKLVKSIEDDPKLPKKKATRALAQYLTLHPSNVEQRIAIIIEHFRSNVRHHLGGRAKAMVVTQSRIQAVRYMQAFQRYIQERGYTDIRPLVAFSGTVRDPDSDAEYTEPGMNIDVVSGRSIGEKQLPERFASPDYQILLVANKYQTGFDQPLLVAMYVDKRLDGVQAVQTLSRLNRMIPGKETPFVLDFVNEAENIYAAFKPYFDGTSLQEESDPNKLEQIKHELNAMQVYHWAEVEAFAKVFYQAANKQKSSDHAEFERYLQPAVDRFLAIEDDDERSTFREKLHAYVRLYAFLSQVIPYGDPELEMLYSFGRVLLPHLPSDRNEEVVKLADEVGLQFYRLTRTYSGIIDLTDGEGEGVKSPTDVGTRKATEEKAPLSEIIDALNGRFGTTFTDEDRLFFEQIKEKAVRSDDIIEMRRANPFDNFQLGLRKKLEDLMIQRMGENDDIVTRYMNDKNFEGVVFKVLAEDIYRSIPAAAAME